MSLLGWALWFGVAELGGFLSWAVTGAVTACLVWAVFWDCQRRIRDRAPLAAAATSEAREAEARQAFWVTVFFPPGGWILAGYCIYETIDALAKLPPKAD